MHLTAKQIAYCNFLAGIFAIFSLVYTHFRDDAVGRNADALIVDATLYGDSANDTPAERTIKLALRELVQDVRFIHKEVRKREFIDRFTDDPVSFWFAIAGGALLMVGQSGALFEEAEKKGKAPS